MESDCDRKDPGKPKKVPKSINKMKDNYFFCNILHYMPHICCHSYLSEHRFYASCKTKNNLVGEFSSHELPSHLKPVLVLHCPVCTINNSI